MDEKKKLYLKLNKQRRKTEEIFFNKVKKPVLLHSTSDEFLFRKILKEGKLKLPRKEKIPKKLLQLKVLLGHGGGIYYTFGFKGL